MDTASLSSFGDVVRSETQDQYNQEDFGVQALIYVVMAYHYSQQVAYTYTNHFLWMTLITLSTRAASRQMLCIYYPFVTTYARVV